VGRVKETSVSNTTTNGRADTKPSASTAMTTAAPTGAALKQKTIMDLFESRKASLAAVLPKHMTPERLLKVALGATARSPDLLACSPASLLLCLMQSAELGLEAGGLLGEAYLVPFKGVATLIPGYRGLAKLARQSGQVASIEAHVVRKQDQFEIEFGLDPRLVHKPFMQGEPKDEDIVAVYGIIRLKDGSRQVDVMTRGEVDAIRARSASAQKGPWVTDFAEMAKKSVLRRLFKLAPMSPELQRALEHEAAVEQNVASAMIDVEVVPVGPQVGDTSKLAEKLTADADGVVQDEPATREPGID
jgi:recombination protein RecT